MSKKNYNLKSPVKWVGGKSKLKQDIIKLFPEKYNSYHEIFLGGGSIGLSIKGKKYFSDSNPNLINMWNCIKNNPEELITSLESFKNNKTQFLEKRQKINSDFFIRDVERAATFIFLNKTCFIDLFYHKEKALPTWEGLMHLEVTFRMKR